MTSGRPVRLALVGAGVRGRDWARVCHESSDVELVAVVDSDQERARRAGVSSEDVAGALSAVFDGVAVTQYRERDKVIPVVLRAESGARDSLLNGHWDPLDELLGAAEQIDEVSKSLPYV